MRLSRSRSSLWINMKFPTELQQNIEKWASIQGVSTEQFVWQAVFEKIDKLSQTSAVIEPE